MNYFNRIRGLQNEAEGRFRNAGGEYRNFEGIQYPRRYHSAAGGAPVAAPQEELNPNDRTWTVVVTNNSSAASATAMVFGANKDLTDVANTAAGVTVTVAESSHLILKTELLGQPVRILGLKMTCVSATQFSNILTIYDAKSTGAVESMIWQPLNYRSAQNMLTTQIDAPSFQLLLKSSTYFTFTINKSEVVTFTFTIVQKASFGNVLRNAPVVAQSSTPAPTGLVQVDMPRGV